MQNIELPQEDVNTLVQETISIFNSLKYAYEGKYDDFEDIMADVNDHTTRVINIIKEAKSPS